MTPEEIAKIADPELRGATAALQRAAQMAREIAIQTNTAIIVRGEDGQIRRITADELRREKAAAEAAEAAARTARAAR
ncbi:hypothetical protein AXK11_05610 [Cephaloticoccus primus]|uniref:Uncharacterized protein n=1 Tax=Cephaloticoccus primus TaxID=1548207 RepID=A0A139SML1_9BACT|nr:hypothetical protein [Cephaloticoccus primus]KXU35817.1 hypothetical protein AXK11_05610 [Cephaloticoccus primus]